MDAGAGYDSAVAPTGAAARRRGQPLAHDRAGAADFDAFVAARTAAFLRYAHLLTGNAHEAEDLVQNALAGAFRHWRRIGTGDPDAYVRRAVLNGHLSARRRVLRRMQARPEAAAPAVDPALQVSERDAMWQALAGLAPRQRAVIVLRYYEDLDEARIAELLGVKVGTVKSQASKALGNLRRLYRPERQETVR